VTIHIIFHFIFFLGGSSFVGHAGSSGFTGGRIIHGFSLFLSPSFHFSHGFSADLFIGLSFGLSIGFPSFFLLNVLENRGRPNTNHCFHPSTAACHGSPGINLEISKYACPILENGSCNTEESISRTES